VSRKNLPAGVVPFDPQAELSYQECRGLTIREEFAKAAMQGLCSDEATVRAALDAIPKTAVALADLLIAELAKGA
jgi:hypothetical protein